VKKLCYCECTFCPHLFSFNNW